MLATLNPLQIQVYMKTIGYFFCALMGLSGALQAQQQAVLGHRSAPLITIKGLKFKDLNKNGKLDVYEDWRQPQEKRIQDLISQMSIEEKVGFMLISTTRMSGDFSFQSNAPKAEMGDGFNEEDLVNTTNMFTRAPLEYPNLNASGTTKGVKERHLRHFILRANPPAGMLASWANNLQALCESTRLGIPALVASNPRNHLTKDNSVGLSVGATAFSKWPGELGLAAMRDLSLTRKFAEIAAQEWKAVGLRKGYQYMADLATEPRWQRIEGTFGEDADLAADMIREVVLGFQGKTLGPNSIALTTKHFPGGGPQVEGQDPHFVWGQDQHYPGKMFDYHLKPFQAAIDAGTSSIMPYYAKPIKTEFEEVGFSFNKAIIQDLLRKKMGFKGIVNSDTGPIDMMPWGVEKLSIPERYAKALEAGVDLFSGTADPTKLMEAVQKGLVTEARINESIARLLKEKFDLGLFENPYVDPQAAERLVGNPTFQQMADLAQRKSIVLLKNEDKLLPIKNKKVYIEQYLENGRTKANPHKVIKSSAYAGVETMDRPEDADVLVFWLSPGAATSMLFGSKGDPIELHLSKNGVDVAYIKQWMEKKPCVLVVNFTSPWLLDELPQPKQLLATFNVSNEALLDVLMGKFNPSGKLPFTIPASKQAVLENLSDVPGSRKGKGYAMFEFGHGLSY